jgi:hypothetical protein
MDRRSGYRECPRCGLRNKPSVAQCDFCGWQFDESQDEWIDQIRALEKISTDQSTVSVDEELSKRIEATIIKPDEISVDDFIGEQDRAIPILSEPASPPQPVSTPPTPEERTKMMEAPPKELVVPGPEPLPERVSEPEPPVAKAEAENAEVTEFVESMIEEGVVGEIREPEGLQPAPIAEEVPRGATESLATKEEASAQKGETSATAPTTIGFDLRIAAIPAAVLVVGAAAYVGILLFSVFQPVHWTVGWTVSILGAAMVTIGCSRLYDIWKHPGESQASSWRRTVELKVKRGDKGVEVFICPLCNEVVSENDDHCPNCGVEFERIGD